jgi:hypothetical protein
MVQGWGFTSTKVQTVFCDNKNVESNEFSHGAVLTRRVNCTLPQGF